MNSYKKYQENNPNDDSHSGLVLDPFVVLKAKIAYQIASYRYRKLSAQNEHSELHRYGNMWDLDAQESEMIRDRKKALEEEIDFCSSQIRAYVNDDNKAKIIPDRCL
jgi:hypothetical protein